MKHSGKGVSKVLRPARQMIGHFRDQFFIKQSLALVLTATINRRIVKQTKTNKF